MQIPGYRVYHNDGAAGSRGTAIYIREEISTAEIVLDEHIAAQRDRITGVVTHEHILLEVYAPVEGTQLED